ncbi:MAG: VWA-like domain-containing protein [Lachnospiraceae bacterium]|nr:VWA-like domain-containing protein [Robinsoniella sp.]MDY3765260.1 VWA-like domain-containing protein [Lachnospiraceae bacterium]
MEENYSQKIRQVGDKIWAASRNELYVAMRYLDVALSSLTYVMTDGTETFGTDGKCLYYDGEYLMNLFEADRIRINRGYLHLLFHCIYRHPFKEGTREKRIWNLSCDVAVEALLDENPKRQYRIVVSGIRRTLYQKLKAESKVLTAEGIYRYFQRHPQDPVQLMVYEREFCVDDHHFWYREDDRQPNLPQMMNQRWKDISERMQTEMETMQKGIGQDEEGLLESVRAENRERYDYREFLRKFAVMREEVQVDLDSFDYIFYTYGLSMYGNMPFIEPQESKDVKKIEEFVIAIDTSISCSRELICAFLGQTYEILKNSESFHRKINLHIIQCDDQIREDHVITKSDEMLDYIDQFEIRHSGGTDFRPVFAYVEELIEAHQFTQLKGLIYFTDGCGIYPKKKPDYDVAFVFMQEEYTDVGVPAWAIKLVLEPEQLVEEAGEKSCLQADSRERMERKTI